MPNDLSELRSRTEEIDTLPITTETVSRESIEAPLSLSELQNRRRRLSSMMPRGMRHIIGPALDKETFVAKKREIISFFSKYLGRVFGNDMKLSDVGLAIEELVTQIEKDRTELCKLADDIEEVPFGKRADKVAQFKSAFSPTHDFQSLREENIPAALDRAKVAFTTLDDVLLELYDIITPRGESLDDKLADISGTRAHARKRAAEVLAS